MLKVLTLNLVTILIFAMTYYILAVSGGDHFNGIDSKASLMDVLYFSSTIQSTVGFGDIYPKSSTARSLVMLQQAMLIVGVVDLLSTNAVNVATAKINMG
jgi:hypothetical protein